MYEKIFRSLKIITLVVLSVITAFALSLIYSLSEDKYSFIPIALILLCFDVLFYLLILRFSHKITKSIVSPLTDYENYDIAYEEMKPIMHKLSSQRYEIKRQTDKANSQKLQLKSVTSNMNDGLIILDENGNVDSINRCAQKFLNIKDADVKYKKITDFVDNEEFSKNIKTAYSGENTHFIYNSGTKALQTYFSPVLENGTVCGVVIFLVDASDRIKAEQIRREFSANVSHELKTPLTTIFGYSQIITNGIAKPDDVKGFAQKIEKESSRLITLIDDIIALSNLEEKGAEYEKESVHIVDIVNEVIEILTDKAKGRNISITASGEDFEIVSNRRQIYELFFNLCDNAIKYNKDDGSVCIKYENKTVSVSDTGIGIPKESIDRIFERFYRVDKSHSKKVNGTGLGLSIVKHIIQNIGAKIDVESTLGEGSCFTVKFK